jgi:hypothetical protein
MTALLRYQAALLLRSHRWLPPLILYSAAMAIGVGSAGQPLLDSLGLAAAVLLPVTAWLVRVCTTNEPPTARAIAAAATSPGRAHLAAVLAGFLAAAALGVAGTVLLLAISDPHTADHLREIPRGPAAVAGLLAALVSVLLGTAVGALTSPPVLLRTGWAVPLSGVTALIVLVISGSPANAAVRGLVAGSDTGAVPLPLLPVALAASIAVAATGVACALSSRRG